MAKKSRKRATQKAEFLRASLHDVDDQDTESGESSASPESPSEESGSTPDATAEAHLPIVGIGASAGGLDAFRKFLTAMPDDSGLAIVLVPHLDPSHESMMVNLLARQTKIPVCEAQDGMAVQANRIYVIPPNKFLSIKDGVLQLSKPPVGRRSETAIDAFLISLAKDRQEYAIGVVLSGTGTNGSQGLKEIKLVGGMVMAQLPDSAEFEQMPQSAIATGLMDYVLPPEDMPAAIIHYVQEPWLRESVADERPLQKNVSDQLNDIVTLLRTRTKYDFRCYRKNMLMRRVQRRMGIRHIEQFTDYLTFLNDTPEELTALCKDLLIGVTGFFRDPDAFHELETLVIPNLIRRQQPVATSSNSDKSGESEASNGRDNAVRVWVPGCATGEEAYSIAMLLFERYAALKRAPNFQIFATDLNDDSLEIGRQGVYPAAAMADVSSKRLKQFFVRADEHHFRVTKKLRESVVFASHNLISDAPFSKLDLLTCRNLLIYLEPDVQRKVIALFHFSLRLNGYLMLGASETIGRAIDLFEPVSKKFRIYHRIGPRRHDLMELPIMVGDKPDISIPSSSATPRLPMGFVEMLNKFLLKKYAPASVLITRRYEILSQQGPLVKYLEFPSGEPTHDLLAMARHGLATRIRAAVHNTIRTGQATSDEDGRVKRDGAYGRCRITVTPISDLKEADGLLLVTFEDIQEEAKKLNLDDSIPQDSPDSTLVEQLQHELKATTDDLQSTIEELENSNEELRISHEEAMSVNEELQSANEELESSKEELQSLNEELTTVNSQLQEKFEELDQANCDISNLIVSADIATLFLDEQLCIQRFTPPAAKLLKLRDSDVDRPFRDLAPKLDDPTLLEDCNRVLRQETSIEKEVWDFDAQDAIQSSRNVGSGEPTTGRRCYLRRILPYRSGDQHVHGVVITLLDITSRINSEAESRRLAAVVQDSNDAVLVLDLNGQITSWNSGAAHMYGYSESEATQMRVFDIVPEQHRAEMQKMLDQIRNGQRVDSFKSQRSTKDGRILDVWLTVTALTDYGHRPAYVATTERDVSDGTQREKDRAELEALRSAEYFKAAEELRAILDATFDAVITANQQGVIVRVNAATERLFGRTSEELIGQTIGMLMIPPDKKIHDRFISRYLETGEPHVIGIGREVICQRKDGSTFYGELWVNEVDHLGLFIGMIRDITERRRLQGEILRAVSEEQRRIGQDLHDTAGQDLAGMAYLIKSHIAFLQETIDDKTPSVTSKEWLTSELVTMQKTSDAINDLQRSIRTVIRGLAPVDVSGHGLMAALADLTAGIRELHHIQCEFHCAPPILMDDNQVATHLYRIAQEAINNGLRHGGATKIRVNLEHDGHDIVLTVHDNGHGINFKQSTENGGFGLPIMGYRANLIGARFSVQPGDHGGTTVCCRLPQVESEAK